jgi:hypothetical protein
VEVALAVAATLSYEPSLGRFAPAVTCLSMNRLAPTLSVGHIVGDFLGHVPGPSFDRVEGDDPQRIPVLPRNHVVDDRTEIGFNEVCLSKRAAELTKVLNDDVGRDVIFGVQWGMIHNSHWASRRGVVRTPDRQSESIVQGDAASAACREGGSGIKPDAASVAIERLIDAGP